MALFPTREWEWTSAGDPGEGLRVKKPVSESQFEKVEGLRDRAEVRFIQGLRKVSDESEPQKIIKWSKSWPQTNVNQRDWGPCNCLYHSHPPGQRWHPQWTPMGLCISSWNPLLSLRFHLNQKDTWGNELESQDVCWVSRPPRLYWAQSTPKPNVKSCSTFLNWLSDTRNIPFEYCSHFLTDQHTVW